MNTQFTAFILDKTGATGINSIEKIQDLWSGYGKIIRIELGNYSKNSVVVKHVQLPNDKHHPRGWNSDLGHQRKIKSYEVEKAWYQYYSDKSHARLPKCLAMTSMDEEVIIILEDLNQAGYHLRKRSLNWEEINRCLKWLARFHASYLGKTPDSLWDVGTYWHLETRPHEWQALTDLPLKEAASQIDQTLNNCTYKTFVHGDAKLANFCFAENNEVAALDFQYVGGGCGMKDVAYFVGSCLSEDDCERYEPEILNSYFQFLQNELEEPNHELELEWRSMYRVAWADFHRFLKGWSPGHWKINSYSERVTKEVINNL